MSRRRPHGNCCSRYFGIAKIPERWLSVTIAALMCGTLAAGCSVRTMAVDRLGNALSGGGSSFAKEDDPELAKAAAPFGLKLMESLLAERPEHRGLRLAAASGFTQYAYAFVQQEADELQDDDGEASARLKVRARRLYVRARDHALAGLAAGRPGFKEALLISPQDALRSARKEDAPLLYWAALSWAAVISLSKNDPDLVADLPFVEALIDRALELDEQLDGGAIHTFLITYEPARKGGVVGAEARSRGHFDRAVELTGGSHAGPFVSLAESVAVPRQDRAEFTSLLDRALAIDVTERPEWRLANLVMQRRARWLLSRTEMLFYNLPVAER